jgi:hypothetical protein
VSLSGGDGPGIDIDMTTAAGPAAQLPAPVVGPPPSQATEPRSRHTSQAARSRVASHVSKPPPTEPTAPLLSDESIPAPAADPTRSRRSSQATQASRPRAGSQATQPARSRVGSQAMPAPSDPAEPPRSRRPSQAGSTRQRTSSQARSRVTSTAITPVPPVPELPQPKA